MKSFFLAASVLYASAKKLVIFGDSLSDDGGKNSFASLLQDLDETKYQQFETLWSDVGYVNRRFTNGRTWGQYLEQSLFTDDKTIDYDCYAVSAATAVGLSKINLPEPVGPIDIPELEDQFQKYNLDPEKDPENDIVMVLIGANDLSDALAAQLETGDQEATGARLAGAVQNIGGLITTYLPEHKNVFVLTIPAVEYAPSIQFVAQQAYLKTLIVTRDEILAQAQKGLVTEQVSALVRFFNYQLLTNILPVVAPHAAVLDIYPESLEVLSSNTMEVYDSMCLWQYPSDYSSDTPIPRYVLGTDDVNCKDFLFADFLHPTTVVHEQIAVIIRGKLEALGVVAPSIKKAEKVEGMEANPVQANPSPTSPAPGMSAWEIAVVVGAVSSFVTITFFGVAFFVYRRMHPVQKLLPADDHNVNPLQEISVSENA